MEWLTIIPVLLVVTILVAMERQRISGFMTELLMFMLRPLGVLLAAVSSVMAVLSTWIRREAQEEDGEPLPGAPARSSAPDTQSQDTQSLAVELRPVPGARPPYHLNRILCAVVLTVLALVMFPADVYLVRMSFAAMGLGGAVQTAAPVELDWMAASSLIACCTLWGIELCDLYRGTNLLPPQLTGGAMHRILRNTAFTSLGLILSAVVLLGIWRGMKLADANAPQPATSIAADDGSLQIGGAPQATASTAALESEPAAVEHGGPIGFDVFVATWVSAAPAVAIALGLLVAMCGIIFLLKYLAVILVGVILLPLALIFLALRMVEEILGTANILKDWLLEFLEAIGQSIIRNVWPPLEAYRDSLHRQARHAAQRRGNGHDARPAGPVPGPTEGPAGAAPLVTAVSGRNPESGAPFGAAPFQEPVLATAGSGAHRNGAEGHAGDNGTVDAARPRAATGNAPAGDGHPDSRSLEDWNWG